MALPRESHSRRIRSKIKQEYGEVACTYSSAPDAQACVWSAKGVPARLLIRTSAGLWLRSTDGKHVFSFGKVIPPFVLDKTL